MCLEPPHHPPTHHHPCQIQHLHPHAPFPVFPSGVQNSGPWDPWLPVVENSLLFAQRTVRPQRQEEMRATNNGSPQAGLNRKAKRPVVAHLSTSTA